MLFGGPYLYRSGSIWQQNQNCRLLFSNYSFVSWFVYWNNYLFNKKYLTLLHLFIYYRSFIHSFNYHSFIYCSFIHSFQVFCDRMGIVNCSSIAIAPAKISLSHILSQGVWFSMSTTEIKNSHCFLPKPRPSIMRQ